MRVAGILQGRLHIVHRGKAKRITQQERKLLRRRQAIEPIIGHLKGDCRMQRCHLKGKTGDRVHAVLCAAGYNVRWLLRMIASRGIAFLWRLYLRVLDPLVSAVPRERLACAFDSSTLTVASA